MQARGRMNMLRDAWEQLQDVRWDEMDWSLVWKSAAIGAACSLACIVCCVAVVFMSPRLQVEIQSTDSASRPPAADDAGQA